MDITQPVRGLRQLTRVSLLLRADALDVGVQTAVLCGLIAREVFVNALACPAGTPQRAIIMTLRADPSGQVTLTIRDTGPWWPVTRDSRGGQSSGPPLIEALTAQLQGTLTYAYEGGTCVTLTFPR